MRLIPAAATATESRRHGGRPRFEISIVGRRLRIEDHVTTSEQRVIDGIETPIRNIVVEIPVEIGTRRHLSMRNG